MIKTFSGQVAFCFAIPEPYLLTLAKTDNPSIVDLYREITGHSKVKANEYSDQMTREAAKEAKEKWI